MIGATADRLGRPFGLLRAIVLVLAMGLIAALPPGSAQAQAGPASLTAIAVTVTEGPPGETRLLLSFNQILPQFSIVTNDNERPLIGFANTVRGAGATIPTGAHGPLKAVEFNQRDTVLTISFVGAGPLHVVAKPIAGKALSLTFTAAAKTGKEAGPAAAGSVPAFADRGPGEDAFEVVPLKYADISEIVGLISSGAPIKPNDTFTPQEPAFGSSGFTGNNNTNSNLISQAYNQNNQDAANTAYGQLIDDSIGVDRRLNAIILRGSPERIARLKAKIAELDVPVQSVILETVFVELTETGARNVGLDFTNSSGQIAVGTYQRGTFLANQGGGSSGIDIAGYGSYSLQAAIYAEVKKGEGRIVSRPRISAQSGTSAKIITGDALPILTSIALSGVNAVSQQVQYVNVGVTLQIAPRVSADGYVTSHIFAEVSSVTGFSQGYPTISQREASTSATVKDGEYFIIGGLTQENRLTTKGKVAGLGDIPLVGELFKLHQQTGSKTELYIVVTPHIVRDGDSAQARAEAERREPLGKNP